MRGKRKRKRKKRWKRRENIETERGFQPEAIRTSEGSRVW
jgi:hypothetical protein